MESKRIVNEEQLKAVSGGSQEEYDKLRELIRTQDPTAEVENMSDMMYWLMDNTGLEFRRLYVSQDWDPNEFELTDGTVLSHEQLMLILYKKYGIPVPVKKEQVNS